METFEAMLSLLVFLSMLTLFTPEPQAIDNSLYASQIANDVWRVFQLRGDLHNFDKLKLNADADTMTELTSLCIEFKEEDVTSCIPKDKITSIRRTVIKDGEPEAITMRIGLG
jgi:hypothetical protein